MQLCCFRFTDKKLFEGNILDLRLNVDMNILILYLTSSSKITEDDKHFLTLRSCSGQI